MQGVGFRPFIYSLSKKYRLKGTVQNNLDHVLILLEGAEDKLEEMVNEIKMSSPPLSKISEISVEEVPVIGFKEFTIAMSQASGEAVPWIAGDAAVCEECLNELKDPSNRRYQYPFINCTQCGPRYTIIRRLPYDRPNTTMKTFQMCHACQLEYNDPKSRRHHAQPICCPECGPGLTLYNQRKEQLAENLSAVAQAVRFIKQGSILAIKGIGGYHFACDAQQEQAVDQLRIRKKRPQRPFAVMVKSLEAARELCHISHQEADRLTSSDMPIVILRRKKHSLLPDKLSPGLSTLGVMLPYAPLHHLLFEETGLSCLVMTSANSTGLPMPYKESVNSLYDIGDYCLTHNRDIYLPVDDSVVQCEGESLMYIRRARGFVPDPLLTEQNVDRILALGGNQKNTFAIGKQNHVIMSPHIGDLENEEMIQSFESQLQHFKKWLKVDEKYIAVDKHPFYASQSIVEKLNGEVIPVQHHHAHHVSCMEDNGLKESCFGLILDGTGYGEDGHIWGFECLYGNANSVERLGHLQYTPLPGGEQAVKEPWRNAVGMLLHYWPLEGKALAEELFPDKWSEINTIDRMIKYKLNTPLAGTCGRLFDAVSAMLGICCTSTYEGEAAIKLSDYMYQTSNESDEAYSFHLNTDSHHFLELDLSPMIREILQDQFNQRPLAQIVQTFHQTIVSSCVEMVLKAAEKRPELNRAVVLSGGSFQNIFLAREMKRQFQKKDFNVYTHKNVPCHDGGLSLGQIIIASRSSHL